MNPPVARILFVEDDVNLGFVICDTLENVPFSVTHHTTGADAWAAFQGEHFDLCLLDVMLQPPPTTTTDGFALARQIRTVDTHIPILFLSALADKDNRLMGLRLGADDYLTKPFSIDELILKIKIFLRRSPGTDLRQLTENTAGSGVVLDRPNLTLYVNRQSPGDPAQLLTHREADVLAYLMDRPNTLVRRDELLLAVWGDDDYFMGRSLDVFISRLRKRLADNPTVRIENVHGVGFVFRTE